VVLRHNTSNCKHSRINSGHDQFSVLAFPCDQFGKQEPGTNESIQAFCQLNYGVTFPVMAKVAVNGTQAIPLFAYLKAECPGILGSKCIKWNFTKFLIDATGQPIKRYAPMTAPNDLITDIQTLMAVALTSGTVCPKFIFNSVFDRYFHQPLMTK
jgi:glutathione peroxidase-family protein